MGCRAQVWTVDDGKLACELDCGDDMLWLDWCVSATAARAAMPRFFLPSPPPPSLCVLLLSINFFLPCPSPPSFVVHLVSITLFLPCPPPPSLCVQLLSITLFLCVARSLHVLAPLYSSLPPPLFIFESFPSWHHWGMISPCALETPDFRAR